MHYLYYVLEQTHTSSSQESIPDIRPLVMHAIATSTDRRRAFLSMGVRVIIANNRD
jgi:hypothetical protein